jgi:hypothetical protein
LISQLLKQYGKLVVYAEPLPVDEILLPPHEWPRHELEGAAQSPEERIARLYGAFCDAAARLDPGRGKLVPYAAAASMELRQAIDALARPQLERLGRLHAP